MIRGRRYALPTAILWQPFRLNYANGPVIVDRPFRMHRGTTQKPPEVSGIPCHLALLVEPMRSEKSVIPCSTQ